MSEAKLYHVGLRREHESVMAQEDGKGLPCPLQYVVLGGITFHRWTQKVEGYGAETTRHRVQGGYAMLTQEQIERVKADLDALRVQWLSRWPDGKPRVVVDEREGLRASRCRLVKQGCRGYIPQASDMSLHGWVYMQESEVPTFLEPPEPPSMAAVGARSEPDTQEEVTQALRKGQRTKR